MTARPRPPTALRDTRLLAAAFGIVLGADWLIAHRDTERPIQALLDESAHLATALLLAAAARNDVPPSAALLGLACGATLIDADHVPLECGYDLLTRGLCRPFPHSLGTVGALTLASFARAGTARSFLSGAAAGAATHLLRDLASGGVPLLWPFSRRKITLPYGLYVALLASALVAAAARPAPRCGGHRGRYFARP